MKAKMIFCLPLFLAFFWSCEKEETNPVAEPVLAAIVLPTASAFPEPQEIIVKFTTPTPCYTIEVEKTVSGNIFEYDFTLTENSEACIQVIKDHEVTVIFDPSSAGTYTLNFLIDGELQETREIVVTE